jgi:anti-sigma28 factor (negative regulator of flagellin synthesis)
MKSENPRLRPIPGIRDEQSGAVAAEHCARATAPDGSSTGLPGACGAARPLDPALAFDAERVAAARAAVIHGVLAVDAERVADRLIAVATELLARQRR